MKKFLSNFTLIVFLALNLFFLFLISNKKDPEQVALLPATSTAQNDASKRLALKNAHSAQLYEKKIYKNSEGTYIFEQLGGGISDIILNKHQNNPIDFSLEDAFMLSDVNLPQDSVWDISIFDNTVKLVSISNNLKYIQEYVFESNYIINYSLTIVNLGKSPATIQPEYIITKKHNAKKQSFIFSGVTMYSHNKLLNLEDKKNYETLNTDPDFWISFNDKYFLSLYKNADSKYIASNVDGWHKLTAKTESVLLQPQATYTTKSLIYAGPKTLRTMEHLVKFAKKADGVFDYGWLFFLTKPFAYIFQFFVDFFQNVMIALFVFTLAIKIFTWPFTTSSHRAAIRMMKLNPKIKDLKERYKDNSTAMNEALLALYKQYGINPLTGCLPSVVQMVLLFPLYKVLSFSIYLYRVPFLWVKDISDKDMAYILNLFGYLNFHIPDFLAIGVWPILMAVSMFLQQSLSQFGSNEDQKFIFYSMPILFAWLMSGLSVGVIIYWTLMNVLTIIQVLYINHQEKKSLLEYD